MRVGKLTEDELIRALEGIKKKNPEVLKSGGIGEDCAVISYQGDILISTDPITASCEDIGALAVNINANDIYASGGEPFCATMTVIAPPQESVEKVIEVIRQASDEADRLGIDIIGGHTEFSDSVRRTIVSITVLGKSLRRIDNNSCKVDDSIIVTKYLAIEGTQILLSQRPELKAEFTSEELEEIYSYPVGVGDVSRAMKDVEISAMHDITEGGVFGSVCEVARACGLGAKIYYEKLPVLEQTRKICDTLNIDFGGLISSGSMLIVSSQPDTVVQRLEDNGIKASVIGKFTCDNGVKLIDKDGGERQLKTEPDKLFEAAKR